jgi:hypothetical protein
MRKETDRAGRYLALLRRELVRAQARLKRAEIARDALAAENANLKTRIERHRLKRPGISSRSARK